MEKNQLKQSNRYINDLRRMNYLHGQVKNVRSRLLPFVIAAIFLIIAGIYGSLSLDVASENIVMLVAAAIIGGYMALNIGANDVANNMGPAVGGKVLTVTAAVVIAAVCESAGAILAGGDVVQTVAKGIINPGDGVTATDFRNLMLSALFAAALWINLATFLNAPVSTTHSIVGGVMGAGIAGAGFGLVNWVTMSKIAASWVISPVFGGIVAAALLLLIKVKILNVEDRKQAARRWVPSFDRFDGKRLCCLYGNEGAEKNLETIDDRDLRLFNCRVFYRMAFVGSLYRQTRRINHQPQKANLYAV